jgi:hypothetical protein
MVDLGEQHDSHLDLFVIDQSIRMLMMDGHTEAQAIELLERRLKLLEELSPGESKELLDVIVAGDN